MLRKLIPLLLAITLPLTAIASGGGGEKPESAPGAALYLPLEAFVVNLPGSGRRMHFMQITVQVMTHDSGVVTAIESNIPPVRDAMIMLLAHQDAETMRSVQGREKVRQQAQTEIQKVLAEVSGVEEGVEAVYFTDFVVQ